MTEDLTNKVVAWATEIATYAAQLPSRQAREDYLHERRSVVADACVDAARRIMTELLALRAGVLQGRA